MWLIKSMQPIPTRLTSKSLRLTAESKTLSGVANPDIMSTLFLLMQEQSTCQEIRANPGENYMLK